MVFAWFINGLFFSFSLKAKYILVDNLHITAIITKKFRSLFGKKQVYIVHMGSHTLFFLKTGKFNRINSAIQRYALRHYDFVLCEGNMSLQFAKQILEGKPSGPKIIETFLGVPKGRLPFLLHNSFKSDSKTIIVLASGPNKFREFYKGLDLMLEGFNMACKSCKELQLKVIGQWDKELIEKYQRLDNADKIEFAGYTKDIMPYLRNAFLALQISREMLFQLLRLS